MRLPERLTHTNLMKLDVKEGPSEFIVTADVPGVNKVRQTFQAAAGQPSLNMRALRDR
jgi:HSP20 family molecular chaperone IbpA